MRTMKTLLASMVLAISAAASPVWATSYSTDESDLWWVPSESGWGMQLVQEGSFIFATIFIYGPTSQPTWATAQLQSQGAGTYVWTGPLFVTTGPWFGGPFNPNAVGGRQAGTMTLQVTSVQNGTVTYSIDGVPVTKQITRQTLVLDNYTGNFTIAAHVQATGCSNPFNNGNVAGAMNLIVNHTGNTMSMLWTFLDGSICTYNGPYDQSGKMGGFTGNYTCTTGEVGQMRMFELTTRPGMISGRVRGGSTNIGCQYTGYFSGIDPSRSPQ